MITAKHLISASLCLTACGASLATEPAPAAREKSSLKADTKKVDAGRYRVLKTVKIGGEGGWDYLTIDSESRRLYIGHNDRVTVLDIDNDKIIGEVTGLKGVHGVSLVPELKKGYITCGKEDQVCSFDLSTLKILAQMPTGKKPDAICYDPASKRIFAFNNAGSTVTVIDPKSDKVLSNIEIGEGPESAVADGKGKVYVNLEAKSKIAVIDSQKMKLLSTWSLAPGEEPTGLAIDPEHHLLVSGCHNQMAVIIDSESSKLLSTVPIGRGVDACGYDQDLQNAFCANGDGTLSVLHRKGTRTFELLQNVQTAAGARTMALDQKKHQVWLVTASAKKSPESHGAEHHREWLPDSFRAIVIGQ